jgi:Lon protease-like protein
MVSMLADAPEDERGFGIVALRPGCTEADGRRGIYELGTMARLTQVDELPDGRFDVVTVGARRFSIDSVDDRMPFTRANVTLHPEPVGERAQAVSLAEQAVQLLKSYREVISTWGVIAMGQIDNLPEDPVVLSYLIASAIVTDLPERQSLLGIADAEQRLAAVCRVLRREIEVMAALPSMPAVDAVGVKLWDN